MRNVRIFYRKLGRLKFVSHLDMTRVMSRLIAKSQIPIWYTEGFNQHIYMNFALPLSLGYESDYEVMDFRLIDESYDLELCLSKMKVVAPPDIEFFAIAEPKKHMKEIGWADFSLSFEDEDISILPEIEKFLSKDTIICEKKGKKGKIKQIDLIPKINSFSINGNELSLRLIAGTEDNLNPSLVMNAFFEQTDTKPCFYSVKRTDILDKDLNRFI